MSMQEGRRRRRRASGVTLEAVATAPCTTQGSGKPRRRRTVVRRAVSVAAMLSVLTAMLFVGPKSALADFNVPEIDPTSMAGALTLLAGGVLVLTDRVRRA